MKIMVRLYDKALASDQIAAGRQAVDTVPARTMPSGSKGPKYGAVTCRLQYEEGWDNLWPVSSDPDGVVRFDDSEPVVTLNSRTLERGKDYRLRHVRV